MIYNYYLSLKRLSVTVLKVFAYTSKFRTTKFIQAASSFVSRGVVESLKEENRNHEEQKVASPRALRKHSKRDWVNCLPLTHTMSSLQKIISGGN